MKSNGSVLRRRRLRRPVRLFRLPVVAQPGARGEAAARRGRGDAVDARRARARWPGSRGSRSFAALLRRERPRASAARPAASSHRATRRSAVAAIWRPSESGWDVHFADLHITLESDAAARAYLTVEVDDARPAGPAHRRCARRHGRPGQAERAMGDHRGGGEEPPPRP